MTEKQLISKIKELRQIRPREDWVILTKQKIFEDVQNRVLHRSSGFSFGFVFQHKPAFATAVVLLVLIGIFGFSQNSLPGDMLFPIKKIAEKSQAVFISEKEQPKHNLELANKRLDELTKIAEANQTQKLASAVNEYQESIAKAAESLAKAEVKEIALEVKKLEEKTERVKSLGIEIGESQELNNALAEIVEREIKDLEQRTLTEEQKEVLNKVKEEYEAGNYSQALESLILVF